MIGNVDFFFETTFFLQRRRWLTSAFDEIVSRGSPRSRRVDLEGHRSMALRLSSK